MDAKANEIERIIREACIPSRWMGVFKQRCEQRLSSKSLEELKRVDGYLEGDAFMQHVN